MTYNHCPYCGMMAQYTHRDGVPVCKCPDKECKGYERWLTYDEFDEQRPKCEECGGAGEIFVGMDPGCDSPGYYQPPEAVTERCEACEGTGYGD